MKKLILFILRPIAFFIGKGMKISGVRSRIDGFMIKFPKEMNSWELGSIWGNYEGSERYLVKKYIKPNDRVLELGACVGVVSLAINRILYNKVMQVSIEPNPDMLPYLEENKLKNSGEFYVENCVISQENEVDFYKGGKAFLSSTVYGKGNSIKIKGISYLDLEKKYFGFTAIVMDIEGSELQFFRDNISKLSNVKKIIFEIHSHLINETGVSECYKLLNEANFYFAEKKADSEVWLRNTVNI